MESIFIESTATVSLMAMDEKSFGAIRVSLVVFKGKTTTLSSCPNRFAIPQNSSINKRRRCLFDCKAINPIFVIVCLVSMTIKIEAKLTYIFCSVAATLQ